MASQVGNDFYTAASIYEACRKEALKLDNEQRESWGVEIEETFPALKRELYPKTKNMDLAQNFFKDQMFRLEMSSKFNEWVQREANDDEVVIRKRRFSSICRKFEEACLDPVFVQFRQAKDNFRGMIADRVAAGDSLEEIQSDLSGLETAIRKTAAWYERYKPRQEEKSPRPSSGD